MFHSRYCYDECKWFGNCPDQIEGEQIPNDKAICSVCGRILFKYDLIRIRPGTPGVWECKECHKRRTKQ